MSWAGAGPDFRYGLALISTDGGCLAMTGLFGEEGVPMRPHPQFLVPGLLLGAVGIYLTFFGEAGVAFLLLPISAVVILASGVPRAL